MPYVVQIDKVKGSPFFLSEHSTAKHGTTEQINYAMRYPTRDEAWHASTRYFIKLILASNLKCVTARYMDR